MKRGAALTPAAPNTSHAPMRKQPPAETKPPAAVAARSGKPQLMTAGAKHPVAAAQAAQTSLPPKPSPFAQRLALATLEKVTLEGLLRRFENDVVRLELECETAVNASDSRAGQHQQLLLERLRKLEADLRDRRATHDDMRESLEASRVREQDLLEEDTVVRFDAQRIRDVDIPNRENTRTLLRETLVNRRAAIECRMEKLAQLRRTVESARDITYGLSAEASSVVTTMECNRRRRAKAKDDAMRQEVDRRALFNELEELKGNIRVYCRVKGGTCDTPAKYCFTNAAADIERQTLDVVQSRSNATSTGTRECSTSYAYDRVFQPDCSQAQVFEEFGALVDSAVDGFKVCAFAYGQTGSGKTHTMEGTKVDPGIIPRSISKVFDRIANLREQQWEYTVSCTFVEIYNDCLRNLLETSDAYHREFADPAASTRLRSKHDIVHIGKSDTTITGIKDQLVRSPAELHKLLELASRNRTVARTNMNERSSRSHCVFTLRISGSNRQLKLKSDGVLCLIDLAGSERVNESGAEGKELKEAIAINRSLMHLGDCISSLGNNAVVSWRNCRLTYLLQNFLAGDGSKMLMFVMVSNREEHVAETNNSLRFAAKVNATIVGTAAKRVTSAPA